MIVRRTPPPRTAPAPSLLGINEGISLPGAGAALFGNGETALQRRLLMLRSLGVTMVRANSHSWPNLSFSAWKESFAEADRFMSVAGRSGIDVVLVIGPWPGARTALYTQHYVPRDMDAYTTWVTRVVERYDGDGVDDMPGLARPVLAWEVDNEPDQHNQVAAREDEVPNDPEDERLPAPPGSFETPAEYAKVLVATSAAIRAADPDATVLSGGMYRVGMPAGRAYLAEVLREPGVTDAIDAISLHCYFTSDSLSAVQRTMRNARALAPDLPVWITETSVPSEGSQPWIDEAWQARMVAGIVGGLFAEGAERIFWHSLADAPAERLGPVGYARNSLFRAAADGTALTYERKPAGEVFQRLAQHLSGLDPADFAEVPAEGGRLLDTGRGWLAFDGEPALPAGARTVEDLTTGEVLLDPPRAPTPAWITP